MDEEPRPASSGGSAPSPSPDVIYAATVFGIAFLLRLIYLFEISSSPFFENLVIDCARYSDWAKEIAAGHWAGERIFYQSPLYAYFLGVIYRFVTTDLFAVRLIQALIGSGSCVIVFLTARRLFEARAGLLAGLLCAAFAPLIYYDAMIMKTVLSIFFGALGLYLLLRALDAGRPLAWLGCGLAWGAAGLVRENYLLVAVAFGVWFAVASLRRGQRAKLRPFWFYPVGLAIAILPVTIRNAAVGGEFALVTSQAGQNFYVGNNPTNRTGAYEVPDFVVANPYWEEKSFREAAEKETGRKMSANEVSTFYRAQALDWMSDKPGPAFVLTGRKFLLFFNNYEVADNQSIYFMERYSWLLRLDFLRFGIVAPLGLLGLVLLWRRRAELAPLYVFGIVYAASVIAFFIFGRYRLPIMLALMPAAAYAISWFAGKLRRREWRVLLKPAIALCCLYAFVYIPAYAHHDEVMAMRHINLGQVHARQAKELEESGEREQATARFNLALEAYADAKDILPKAAEPHLYAARALVEAGMLSDAEKQYLTALQKAPGMASARVELARLLFDERIGAIFEASEHLGPALRADPENAEARELADQVEAALKDTAFYRELLERNPKDTWALTYHGISSLMNRDTDAAFVSLEKALKIDPGYIPANNAMALLFLHARDHDAALFYARQVRRLGGTVWRSVRTELESCPDHRHNIEEDSGSREESPGQGER